MSYTQYVDEKHIPLLPEEMQDIFHAVGIENFKKIMKLFLGNTIYFPKKPPRSYIQRFIIENYTGKNRKQLQKQLSISECTFYRYLNSKT